MKTWVKRVSDLLSQSLGKVPQELNELDWKEELSSNSQNLCRHISAFANYPGGGFMVFGISNKDAKVIGIDRSKANEISEKLSNLCRDGVSPVVSMDHSMLTFQEKEILVVHFRESAVKPVFITGKTIEDSYIRSGGSTRKASRQEVGGLMLNSKTPVFEELHASKLKNITEVMTLLDFGGICKLLKKPVPTTPEEVIYWLTEEKMIVDFDGLGYYITNFGALSAAHSLTEFDGLDRKSIRVIKYEGKNKAGGSKEYPGNKGYAIGFEGLINFVKSILPGSEVIKSAFREETSVYPEIALRELIANALIHQDFTIRGSGPMIEIFEEDRKSVV